MKSDLKLLQLEDEMLDAELIQRCLKSAGMAFSVSVVSDKEAFEKALSEGGFDAVLADNSLPQFNSIEALRVMQERHTGIPFILVTGTVSEEFAVDIIHKGADDYILKNNLTRLPSAITRAIEKRRITHEKLLTEAALRKSEEEYRLLFDVTPLAAWVIDEHSGQFLTVNAAAVKLYGYTPDEFKGMRLEVVQHPGTGATVTHVRKDGSLIDAEVVSTSVFYENRSARLVLVNDLTQKLKTEAEIRQINQELRELSAHLQNIREEERIQIARDIHDELGQQLTGLKMEVHALSKKVKVAKKEFGSILSLIEDLVHSVRRISANLRPYLLDDFGLVEALKWQTKEIVNRFGIKIEFTSAMPEIDLPSGISTGLFRIYQEALTNAVRHANAHLIESSIRVSDDNIVLEIRDDGQGMDLSEGPKKKSFGLLGIKERVFLLNGQYTLSSEVGKGTHLMVSIPL